MRGVVRLWLVPVGVVVLLLALVAAFGGFRSGQGAQGRAARAGEDLDLARWQLVVHGTELVRDEYDEKTPTRLRVDLLVTLTAERSVYGLPSGLVTVATPTGPLAVEADPATRGTRTGDFDPDVAQEVALDFRWPAAPAQPPALVRVLVHDEREGTNYLFSSGGWGVTPAPVAHLDLPCPDRR